MATAETIGRVSTTGIAQQISTVLTNMEADTATDDTNTWQVGGVGGVTTEPCMGFVHVRASVDGTDSTEELAAVDAESEFDGAISGHNIALIPGGVYATTSAA